MNEILGKIIDLMRAEGLDIDSPYDVENFFTDYGSHNDMFETGRFGYHCEYCQNLFTGKVRKTEMADDPVFCSDECVDNWQENEMNLYEDVIPYDKYVFKKSTTESDDE
jgi:hypothetical protein